MYRYRSYKIFSSLQPIMKGQLENAVPKQGKCKVYILDIAFIYDAIPKKKAVLTVPSQCAITGLWMVTVKLW